LITAEFDPLRDEGNAYAAALQAAGVPVQHVQARGHMHTSITMVDVVITGKPHRDAMAEAIKGFFA
jgi:acetyl esterase/lipase